MVTAPGRDLLNRLDLTRTDVRRCERCPNQRHWAPYHPQPYLFKLIPQISATRAHSIDPQPPRISPPNLAVARFWQGDADLVGKAARQLELDNTPLLSQGPVVVQTRPTTCFRGMRNPLNISRIVTDLPILTNAWLPYEQEAFWS